jgi:hypothetical protein
MSLSNTRKNRGRYGIVSGWTVLSHAQKAGSRFFILETTKPGTLVLFDRWPPPWTITPRSATATDGPAIPMKSMFFTIFISIFYAIGLGLLLYALWSAKRSNAAANWPTANGKITSCALSEKNDGDGGTTYEVKVQYDYSVDGRNFSGSRLAFGYAGTSGKNAHQQIYKALRSARTVAVRYDPTDPANSTLSFGIHRSIRFQFAFAITWLAFVVGFTVIWWVSSQGDNVLLRNMIVH